MKNSNDPRRRSFRARLKKWRRRITYSNAFIHAVGDFAAMLILAYSATLKIQWTIHPDYFLLDRRRILYGFWHGRQFMMLRGWAFQNIGMMTELSWAGSIQTRILYRLGFKTVRGSSKRQGAKALIAMKRLVEQGHSAGFALDGPTGPIYESKPGILFLAQKLGLPVVTVAASASPAWVLRSTWCRYMFPRPFARCAIIVGQPVPAGQTEKGYTTEQLDAMLNSLTSRADRQTGFVIL